MHVRVGGVKCMLFLHDRIERAPMFKHAMRLAKCKKSTVVVECIS